nr:Mur ligase domain-containing protein [Acidimicrobiales bacterium]
MAEGVLDLSVPRRVHVVGVGGAGMSAIAEVLAAMGHDVTGSDLKPSAGLERLEALGVAVTVGHAAANLGQAELLTRSTAVPDRNPECRAAAEAGIPVLSRADVLTAICAQRSTVAVAGTHGKTTTASMLALVLRQAGVRPSFIIGGDVNEIGTGAAWDSGDLLVVEADESDGT